jgi:hypothetical protein
MRYKVPAYQVGIKEFKPLLGQRSIEMVVGQHGLPVSIYAFPFRPGRLGASSAADCRVGLRDVVIPEQQLDASGPYATSLLNNGSILLRH